MSLADSKDAVLVRRRWRFNGQVQGVGLRPFVYRLAGRWLLTGFVCNDSSGVTIEVQGTAEQLHQFAMSLFSEQPPLLHLQSELQQDIEPQPEEQAFHIVASVTGLTNRAQVTADAALCDDCLTELLDANDRRSGYGLINCTNCGPRYTIIQRVPYDRPNTTMARFSMCDRCRHEYVDPLNRRFHAQPIACPACGPQLQLVDGSGRRMATDPIVGTVQHLNAGRIVAVKGLGGFHLAVLADDERAVARLRRLKQRDRKPFAVMGESLDRISELVILSDAATKAMRSPACPIVLAPKRHDAPLAVSVAPDNHRLGVMLPYTPIHHLLFACTAPRLAGRRILVMTSGNISDEPLVIDNAEAVERLGPLCDAILWHDRPIERSVDDSVMLDMGEGELLPIRRARGYVPAALELPHGQDAEEAGGLCVGGELKNTIAVVREGRAILSHHLGDLTHALAFEYFNKAIDDMRALFGVEPAWIAHDLHPMYLSTVRARELSDELGVSLLGVQHHHAHAASVMAEHGERGPVLAVVCDGTGYGDDGTIWGGELLRADLIGYERLAGLRPLRLPGGDAAARDTRRCALALLHQTLGDDFDKHPVTRRLVPDDAQRAVFAAMIRDNIHCAVSSGAGRLFDAVAALLGLCTHNDFEAQAALALEAAASSVTLPSASSASVTTDQPKFILEQESITRINLAPLVMELIQGRQTGRNTSELAALFHDQLAWAWERVVAEAARRTGVTTVALSGGVFCNQRLTEQLTGRLVRRGMRVLRHRIVPANDGGLAFGQAAVATARLAAKRH